MRALLSAAAGLAALFGTANAAVLSLSTDAETVDLGETFDVSVIYEGEPDQPLAEIVFDLFFSDGAFDFVSGVFGDGMGGNPLDFPGGDEFLAEFSFDDLGDAVTVLGVSGNDAATLASEQPISFVLATLTFEVVAGLGFQDIGLDIFVDAFDPEGDPIEIVFGNDVVTIEAVPLPGALVFMATGLAGFAARRRMAA